MISHPAKFTATIVEVLHDRAPTGLILDPFAGTGRIHQLRNLWRQTVGVEIEPEWANLDSATIVGNALHLPFLEGVFDGVVTSPCYANRLADSHHAQDGSVRHSYTHDLGRRLHPDNSGALQWGDSYRNFHVRAWGEALRVLRPGGAFVLNCKDHIRAGVVQPVTAWHIAELERCGLDVIEDIEIPVTGLGFGANATIRVDHEHVVVMRRRVS